jgi:hypothetical protein
VVEGIRSCSVEGCRDKFWRLSRTAHVPSLARALIDPLREAEA